MKRLKIFISLIGLFGVFSLASVNAMENVLSETFNSSKKDTKIECCEFKNGFTLNNIYSAYVAMKSDLNFEKNFKEEIKNFLKNISQSKEIFNNLMLKSVFFDENDREAFCKYTRSQFMEDVFENYVVYKIPEYFDDEFIEKIEKLDFIDNIHNIFEKIIFEVNEQNSISVKKYIEQMAAELEKFKINCMFKIEKSRVVCCSNSVKFQCLADLVNYCMCVLRFGEFVLQNQELIDECFEYRKKVDFEK